MEDEEDYIYGFDLVKAALAVSLVSGFTKEEYLTIIQHTEDELEFAVATDAQIGLRKIIYEYYRQREQP